MEQVALGLPLTFTEAPAGHALSAPLLPALAVRLQANDHSALEPFIHLTRPMAFRLACHMLNDYHGAQDVLQDAYIKVLRDIRTLRNPHGVKTWFLRIVSTGCLVALRRRRPASLSEMPPEELVDDPQIELATGRRIALRQALQLLSESDRAIVLMRDCMDMTYEEISETLRIPLGTTKSRLFEARRRLIKRLMESEVVS
jgi:RNA polymerase sigma-70 factor (ECF subfamily)